MTTILAGVTAALAGIGAIGFEAFWATYSANAFMQCSQ